MSFNCRVCHTNESGIHFGAEVCRACSAFFRRSVARELTYKCKKNDTCETFVKLPSMRTMCRSCRYAKCVSIGMRKDSVQKNRDVYGKRDLNSLQSSFIFKPIAPRMPLLERIAGNYSNLESIRKLVHSSGDENISNQPVNYKQSIEVLLKDFTIVVSWISNSFSHFECLTDSQKDLLLRNFYLQFVILEGGFFSCRQKRNDIWFLPSGNYIDCVHPETYYHDPEGLQPMTSQDAVKMFGSSFETYKRNVSSPMLNDDVDVFEFLALTTLILFATGVDGQSEECYEMSRRIRETVQHEMLQYYQNTKEENEAAFRLGNIIALLPNLQRATRRFQEDVELSNVLNAYSVDKTFYDKCLKA